MRSRGAPSLLLALVLAAACGGGQAVRTSSSSGTRVTAASGTPSSQQRSLVAIGVRDGQGAMTLRLVDATGRVAATTQFTPPPYPVYSNCAPLLQPPVRVAAGAVYFADSTGLVRRLAADGTVSQVTTFKLGSPQQALSFAVSPDGGQLIAIVLSTPPLHNPPPRQLGDPIFDAGTWSLDLEMATPGGQATEVLHRNLGSTYPTPTVITGWDAVGPTATLNSVICVQNPLPSFFYTGTLVHLGTDGTHLERIGGADCIAWAELVNGTTLCGASDWQSFTVRTRNGDIVWSGGGGGIVFDVALSPDASAVASRSGTVFLRYPVDTASFARTSEPQSTIVGWSGPHTVVVVRGDGHVGFAPATNPTMFSDIGLTVGRSCPQCSPYEVRAFGTIVSS